MKTKYIEILDLVLSNPANQLSKSSRDMLETMKSGIEMEERKNNSKIVNEKAMYWLNNGRVGSSSKAIWNYFMGNENFDISHPYDPDDFSRCYKLLEFIPEWKERIEEIGTLSQQWKNLSENWQTLTDMYERNQHENWENSKKIGMHKFMSNLIN